MEKCERRGHNCPNCGQPRANGPGQVRIGSGTIDRRKTQNVAPDGSRQSRRRDRMGRAPGFCRRAEIDAAGTKRRFPGLEIRSLTLQPGAGRNGGFHPLNVTREMLPVLLYRCREMPWHRSAATPKNALTGKAYRGINVLACGPTPPAALTALAFGPRMPNKK